MAGTGAAHLSTDTDEKIDEKIDAVAARLAHADISRSTRDFSDLDLSFSVAEIIDKFLFAAVTDNDEQHVTIFLIVFRRFTRPQEVVDKLIARFHLVGKQLNSDLFLSRFVQMRLCQILKEWISLYPADFCSPHTYQTLSSFVESIVTTSWVTAYTIEIIQMLDRIRDLSDIDASWSLSASNPPRSPIAPKSSDGHFDQSRKLHRDSCLSFISHRSDDSSGNSLQIDPSQSEESVNHSRHHHLSLGVGHPPLSDLSSFRMRDNSSGSARNSSSTSDTQEEIFLKPSDTYLSPMSASRRPSDASLLESPVFPAVSTPEQYHSRAMSKLTLQDVSNALLEIPPDAIAMQINRIAWQIFVRINPRDFLRYMFSPKDADGLRNVSSTNSNPVASSIRFVNYLADWVASVILVQSRTKDRTRLIEKMMMTAAALRDTDSFDPLMGVLSGLSSHPIYRLSESFEPLRSKPIYKKFQSLSRLMSTSKSFAAYRLALSTSGEQTIPYLGCHLQDMTRFNEGKPDTREDDGLVNWTKFVQLGRSAAVVVDCPNVAPDLPVDRHLEDLILRAPIFSLDDDILYAASHKCQPKENNKNGGSKFKRFLENVSLDPHHLSMGNSNTNNHHNHMHHI